MDQASMLIMGASVATNIIFVKWKIEKERYSDALLDGIVFIGLILIFAKTVSGLSIATLASSFVSFYLFFFPPKEFFNLNFINNRSNNKSNKRSNREIWEKYKKQKLSKEDEELWKQLSR